MEQSQPRSGSTLFVRWFKVISAGSGALPVPRHIEKLWLPCKPAYGIGRLKSLFSVTLFMDIDALVPLRPARRLSG
jgi:hypothetical protein